MADAIPSNEIIQLIMMYFLVLNGITHIPPTYNNIENIKSILVAILTSFIILVI